MGGSGGRKEGVPWFSLLNLSYANGQGNNDQKGNEGSVSIKQLSKLLIRNETARDRLLKETLSEG